MASLKTASVLATSTKVTFKGKDVDVQAAAMACGTWAWGDKSMWGWDSEKDLPPVQETWALLTKQKIGFFDTAEIYGYGESEKIIGKLLKETSEEDRKDIVVATKWLPIPAAPMRWFPKGMEGCLRYSLARLGVESVDLYQIHGPIHYLKSIETVAKELAHCVKKGLCKTVGVSNYSKEQMIQMHDALAKHGVPLASNQIEYSLLRRLPEFNGLIAAAHERNIVPLAYSPLGQGRLTGKYSVANPPPGNRRFSKMPMEEIEPLLEVMREIAERRDVPVSCVGLNWIMCKGVVPLPGARNAKQAEQNAKAFGWRLTDDEIAKLEEKSREGKTSFWQHG